jgi:septal ring factor EnvC (AmiA/AmiB activator)
LIAYAASGGELDRAVGTVELLTAGQARLVDEYDRLRRERTARLAELSRVLESARSEATELVARRRDLDQIREQVEKRVHQLELDRRSTDDRLAEMRERERALGRLLERLTTTERYNTSEDVRRFRGALPWPADGHVAVSFGRHYLPRYATYTVCNGLRLDVASGSEVRAVFQGVVAFARHFKGYGNMVVLDHGNGVYSLVAGLATIHVRLDQRVTMGARLGLASPPSDTGNVYFEIRFGDEPQDPRRWLQLEEDRFK